MTSSFRNTVNSPCETKVTESYNKTRCKNLIDDDLNRHEVSGAYSYGVVYVWGSCAPYRMTAEFNNILSVKSRATCRFFSTWYIDIEIELYNQSFVSKEFPRSILIRGHTLSRAGPASPSLRTYP